MKNRKYCKVRDCCHYTGEYRGAALSICNLKYRVTKKIPIIFHNASNYNYHFIIKQLAEALKKQFTCLEENTENYITFAIPIKKEVTEIHKLEKKSQKIYLTFYSLLIEQDLWQAHYQSLFIIYLTNFIKLNVNQNMMIKDVKHVELNISIEITF